MTPDPPLTTVTSADRNSLGGDVTVLDPPTTTFGLYQDDVVTTTIKLDIDAYELEDLERAIAKSAKSCSRMHNKTLVSCLLVRTHRAHTIWSLGSLDMVPTHSIRFQEVKYNEYSKEAVGVH